MLSPPLGRRTEPEALKLQGHADKVSKTIMRIAGVSILNVFEEFTYLLYPTGPSSILNHPLFWS